MFILTGFGDEISPDLDEQLRVLGREEIRHVEFRGAWDKNISAFTDEELVEARAVLQKHGCRVSAVGSPIGKVKISDDFEAHFRLFQRVVEIADALQTPFIRIFSYYAPNGGCIAEHREEVMQRMRRKAEYAAQRGKVLLHENEHAIYGESAELCRDLHQTVDLPNLRATFDFANFVVDGHDPVHAFRLLRPYIAYVHVKDATRAQEGAKSRIVPAGEGDGHIPELLSELAKDGKNYFLSLEPHLAYAGASFGRSGPELFVRAIRALKKILADIGADWR